MSKIGIFYGSSTGSTSEVAQRLGKALGAEANIFDVASADAAEAAAFDVLLLGSSTWGIGDLQDDWEDFLPKLAEQPLAGRRSPSSAVEMPTAIPIASARLWPRSRKAWQVLG